MSAFHKQMYWPRSRRWYTLILNVWELKFKTHFLNLILTMSNELPHESIFFFLPKSEVLCFFRCILCFVPLLFSLGGASMEKGDVTHFWAKIISITTWWQWHCCFFFNFNFLNYNWIFYNIYYRDNSDLKPSFQGQFNQPENSFKNYTKKLII